MQQPKPKNAVMLQKVYVWYNTQNDNIQLTCDDPRITDDASKRKGLNIAISPRSKPKTYRWLDLLLQREGIPRP